MKKILFLLMLGWVNVALLVAQKKITLEDCFVSYKFYPQSGGNFKYLRDGQHFANLEKSTLHIKDVLHPERDSVIQLTKNEVDFDHFEFSNDESKILLTSETEPVYRHSTLAKYWVFDFARTTSTPVIADEKLQFACLSPDGQKVAFVKDNNLFFKDLTTGRVEQITSDGKRNQIINGLPDWVYEEEFSPVTGNGMVATVWSPDSKKIAFLRFDERDVPSFQMTFYRNEAYPELESFKYPKVGAPNSVVTVHYFDVEKSHVFSPEIKKSDDDYLVRLHWDFDNQLIVSRLNRDQTQLDLIKISPSQQKNVEPTFQNLLSETDPAYIDIEVADHLHFLKNGKQFIWMSERTGYKHAFLYENSGKLIRQLTSGDFDVTEWYGLDEVNGKFYFQTATPTPLDRQIWEGALDGSPMRLLTEGRGTHEAQFSPNFEFFSLKKSDANTPPVVTLHRRSGEIVRNLVKNDRVAALRKESGLVQKTFWSFRNAEGIELHGWMLRPAEMMAGKKYPVLFDVYGGPGSQTVQNQYDGYMNTWHQMLVQQGVIVVSLDNRGTGGRGAAFKKSTQMQLGKLETEDQIAAARHLATLDFVDAARIGIWGWSFGGYLSTSCLLKGNDVFKMAMAVAPVVNWKWYDSAYTERYMRTTASNSAGYDENSPIHFAKNLKGKYLLCHGIADDNVHWQHAVEMTKALIDANKQFETYYYPNRNHGIYGENATLHLFRKLTDFVLQNL